MKRFLIKVRRANRSVWHKLVLADTAERALERAIADGLATTADCSVEVEPCDYEPKEIDLRRIGRVF